ncbi:hypothetical protein V5O48_013647 [Marasmius crinis-equi]|uniref:F-box domain-containing protein n=1 Tax=Marasmius crinis-equi TaxID=585013 RepID=A0ABR3EZM0_9AGAR
MEFHFADVPHTKPTNSIRPIAMTIQELFRSVLTRHDRHCVKNYLAESESEMKSYEDEIQKLKATVMALETRRDWLKRSMMRYRSLLSPIRILPLEILSMIFGHFCEDNPLDAYLVPPVVTLSLVCAQWRALVLSTPGLWSSLSIDFENWDMLANDIGLERMTRLFLERSKKSPLTLVLRLPDPKGCEFRSAATLGALVNSADRWHDITLLAPWNISPSSPILEGLRGHLPILSALHLNGAGPDDDRSKFDFFSYCPALHSLQIQPGDDPYGPEYPSPRLVLPWEQIKSLKMYDSFAPSAVSLLSQCPNVESLELSLVGGGTLYPKNIASDVLRSLSIEAREQDDVSTILHSTTLRNLNSVEIRGDIGEPTRDWPYWDGGPMASFIARSYCTITSLRLKWVPITDMQAVSLLELMPGLQSLHLEEYTRGIVTNTNRMVTGRLLNRLSLGQDEGSECYSFNRKFLPRLADLSLVMHDDDTDSRALLTAVLSRWLPDPEHASAAGVDCIRSVAVVLMGQNCSDFDPFASLECLRAGGVRVSTSRVL